MSMRTWLGGRANRKSDHSPAANDFDEDWYLAAYPDVAAAVADGRLANGLQHYLASGRLEGRFPSANYDEGDQVDAAWYATAYPFATQEIAAGHAADMEDHYARIGRFRGYLPNRFAPRPDDAAALRSRFGGLWTDHGNAADLIEGKRETGRITDQEATLLHRWIAAGYVILERAIDPDLLDRAVDELNRAYAGAMPDLLFECASLAPKPRPWQPEMVDRPTKALDMHWTSATIRDLIFAPPIRNFLELIFERRCLASQSLGFLRGSAQGFHQDTTYVPYTLPMQFAASWIALEDVSAGAGELAYLHGSHALEEHRHAGQFKSVWEAERMLRRSDMRTETQRYEAELPARARAAGMTEETFLARKGDVLIWHADLVHGGRPISQTRTRRSVVTHYCPREVAPTASERNGMAVREYESGGARAFYTSGHYSS